MQMLLEKVITHSRDMAYASTSHSSLFFSGCGMTLSSPKTAIHQVIMVIFLVTHLRVLPG